MTVIGVVPDPLRTACRPAEVLRELINTNRMLLFETAREAGDCHEAAEAIMRDLHAAGASFGWEHCAGMTNTIGLHSWLECDGWAIDAANMIKGKPILIQRASDYRRGYGVTSFTRGYSALISLVDQLGIGEG